MSAGQEVKQGQVVALSGGKIGDDGKGNSQGAHIHFELYKNGNPFVSGCSNITFFIILTKSDSVNFTIFFIILMICCHKHVKNFC